MQRPLKTANIVLVALLILAGGGAGVAWWWYDSHPLAGPVPYFSFGYVTSIPKDAPNVDGLVLWAHSDCRQSLDEGYLVFVANVGDQPVRFNTRPFRQALGLGGWAEDAEGKRHPLLVKPVYPKGNCQSSSFLDDWGEDNVPLRPAEIVTLKPGNRFSISITLRASDDPRFRISRASDASAETLGPFYRAKDYALTYSYVRGGSVPSDVWQGTLESNRFTADQIRPPVETRFRVGCFPRDLFDSLRDSIAHPREDVGLSLLVFQHLCLLARHGILRPEEFDEVLKRAVVAWSPLVRLEATRCPKTWKDLLLDVDPDVRRRALEKAAARDLYPRRGEITEIVAGIYLYGSPAERLLAIEAFAKQGHSGSQWSLLWWDIRAKALEDPDPAVRKRAQELFKDFHPPVQGPF